MLDIDSLTLNSINALHVANCLVYKMKRRTKCFCPKYIFRSIMFSDVINQKRMIGPELLIDAYTG